MLSHLESLFNRRQKLFASLPPNSSFLIFSNQVVSRNADVNYPFRQDSNFYYLTGLEEDKSAYFLKKDLDGEKIELLFIPKLDPQEQIWIGKVNGIEQSRQISGIQQIFFFEDLLQEVSKHLQHCQQIYFDPQGSYQQLRDQISQLIFSQQRRQSTENLVCLYKTNYLLRNLRLYKDQWEITQMQKAADITIQAHLSSVKNMYQRLAQDQEVWEYQICSDLYHYFGYQNCTWSYPAIVACGANACTLHYTRNQAKVKKGELLLIDAGCEYNYYASDLTRCYPVSGRFTQAQKEVYQIVLQANQACLEELTKPNCTYRSYHQVSVQVLTTGLIDLGILQGSLETNLAQKTYTKYYMHGVGHWLGLDVHDAGIFLDAKGQRVDLPITTGMTLTVEPGLYFPWEDENLPKDLRGLGIRIEDNILKTENGIHNFTAKMPKKIEDIENLAQIYQ